MIDDGRCVNVCFLEAGDKICDNSCCRFVPNAVDLAIDLKWVGR